MLVLEGPPGIGKTRRHGAVHERANAAAMRTLSARAGELERDFPYGTSVSCSRRRSPGPGAMSSCGVRQAHLVRLLFDIAGAGDLDGGRFTGSTGLP